MSVISTGDGGRALMLSEKKVYTRDLFGSDKAIGADESR